MHTTPLLTERDTDLRRAIHAIDPEVVTTVLPAVVQPARDPKRGVGRVCPGGLCAGAVSPGIVLVSTARRPPGTSTTTEPPPGVPGGKFSGRSSRGWSAM